jgi:hypothetical protein
MSGIASANETRSTNRGWLVGFLIILAVFAVAAALWFHYHP